MDEPDGPATSGEDGRHGLWAIGATPHLLFTTNPGLEDIVASEFRDALRPLNQEPTGSRLRPFGFGGHVMVDLDVLGPETAAAALALRSVHHVIRPLYAFTLPSSGPEGLRAIASEVGSRDLPDLEAGGSFRVTSKRSGEHSFGSMDIQKCAGAALVERYGAPVDLTGFAVEVRVDVFDQTCIVGVQLTRAPLSHRYLRRYNPGASLKANVAYALLHMAGIRAGRGPLLDPFCGSGTILLEAANLRPGLEIEGSDLNPDAIAGTRVNLADAGLTGRVGLRCCDARHLAGEYPAGHFGAIVTNPPFGIRIGRHIDFRNLYRQFFQQAATVLKPGGRLVLIVWKRGVVDRLNREQGLFVQRHVRVVETGGIFPRTYILDRR